MSNAASFCKRAVKLNEYSTSALDIKLRSGELQIYPIFEKIPGHTFHTHLTSQRRISESVMRHLMLQVMLALDSLTRDRQVYTHNDLHTANVMITNTTVKSYTYQGSDGEIRTIPTHGHRMVIIDQGMACVGKGDVLGQFSRPYCPAVDVFKFFTEVWRYRKSTVGKWLRPILTVLFGEEGFSFLRQKNIRHSFYQYAAYLYERGDAERSLAKSLGVTYLHAVLILIGSKNA